MKPVIGVTGCYQMFPSQHFHSVERYFINKAYLVAVKQNGGLPMPIPILEDLDEMKAYLDLIDALMLPGGDDIDPMFFGEDPHRKLGIVRPEIDKYELDLLKLAFEADMPVFGICRGQQIINVARGGTLYQDIHEQSGKETILHQQTYRVSTGIHRVSIKEGSLLHGIFGNTEVRTNTMHHQAVKDLGKDLIVTATSPDGIIEGIESTDGKIIGVQWHPELLIQTQEEMNGLFRYFIQNMAMGHKGGTNV